MYKKKKSSAFECELEGCQNFRERGCSIIFPRIHIYTHIISENYRKFVSHKFWKVHREKRNVASNMLLLINRYSFKLGFTIKLMRKRIMCLILKIVYRYYFLEDRYNFMLSIETCKVKLAKLEVERMWIAIDLLSNF